MWMEVGGSVGNCDRREVAEAVRAYSLGDEGQAMRVVIAEDDPALGSFLKRILSVEADEIVLAADGEAALTLVLAEEPDLFILDLDLPLRSGLEVLEIVRSMTLACPILILSARAETATRVQCLEKGADDCLMKPFSLSELRARCRAMLRRQQATRALLDETHSAAGMESVHSLSLGGLHMQRLLRQVVLEGSPVRLTNREYALLEQLMLAGGAIVSREALRLVVWEEQAVDTNALDVHLAALRRKLRVSNAAPFVETVRGRGFRLSLPEASAHRHPLPVDHEAAFAAREASL